MHRSNSQNGKAIIDALNAIKTATQLAGTGTPFNVQVMSGQPYTVPAGKNARFFVFNSGAGAFLSINGVSMGATTNGGQFEAGPGSVLAGNNLGLSGTLTSV